MTEPRALTRDEVADRLIAHLDTMLRYWLTVEPPYLADKEALAQRLDGVIFSTLVALDGEAAALPGFIVCANPHPDDEEFHRKQGEPWFPEGIDIAGDLHDRWVNRKRA